MEPIHGWLLVTVGAFFLAGFAAHVVGQRAHVPRVTLLLLLGFIAGPGVLGLVPERAASLFPIAAAVALSLVGFTLGERFLGKQFRSTGRTVIIVSAAESLGAAVAVLVILILWGVPPVLALLFAGVAPASAPAATIDVIRESRASGELTNTVLGVVAIDDAFGIILFSLLLTFAQAIGGEGAPWGLLVSGVWNVLGAIALGGAVGLPMAWLTGRVRPGELTLVETLGFVLVCGGLADVIGVSYLLACITLGAVVANRAHHHTRPFHAIEGVSQPFLILFFILAGFEFDPGEVHSLGAIALLYVVTRSAGKISGAYLGARAVGASVTMRKYVGWCLLPQAGVALGLGLLAAQRFPRVGAGLLSVLVATTFLFEVGGPIATRMALKRAGEIPEVQIDTED